jgi:NAD(P)-dependent dehydrogenase (short-subunit alcohol dehydrogenase family)
MTKREMELNEHISAVVVGGASGIGEATVRALRANNVRVAILDQNSERGNSMPVLAFKLSQSTLQQEKSCAISTVCRPNSIPGLADSLRNARLGASNHRQGVYR